MSEIMVEVSNVSVKFHLSRERIDSIKEYIIKKIKNQIEYDEFMALQDVSLTVEKGESVALIGLNGCGKSTLLKTVAGVLKPFKGSVRVYGTVAPLIELGAGFDHDLTARENVELATQISKNPLNIDKVLHSVGLSDRKNNFPSQLSGGEQQRVAIARAIAKNPKLLLCDEPTGALDYNTGKAILKLLQDICRKEGVTVIIITHNLALTHMGDKVIEVKNGRIQKITINENPVPVERIEW